ncbi:uncharacterized protein DUF3301 [Plasticicumulans lactativorans]|uniref:Uncharacterized protein DUF3301 n=1 Tax=Plasticicumulans lactativorans TaxID=1133106 RepID=A0A4V2SD89_9GAMM|nr:DUF3301 domain-containing protein [Plasticicumulans lactativorans]TCO82430.1 uncharacterized protein DUF3301 [Plasticicumulans lactativorans]
MTPSQALLVIVIIAAAGALWRSALAAREQALVLCRRFCSCRGLQLLDDTVEVRGLALVRDADGWPVWRRRYGFEFTPDGQARFGGELVLRGLRLESLHAAGDFEEGAVIRAQARWRE